MFNQNHKLRPILFASLFFLSGVGITLLTGDFLYKFGIDAVSGPTIEWQSGANNFFNQEDYTKLSGSKFITINGEVEKESKLRLSDFPLRTVTVIETREVNHVFKGTIIDSVNFIRNKPTKEAPAQISPNGTPSKSEKGYNFYGTYRYDGYALCDILSSTKVDKESKKDFWPPVDLYIEVKNDAGDCAVFSWGELFYSANMYNIIIARRVARVMTGKTGELWALPTQTQLVVESDLLSERNIPNPTSITIKSLKGDYIVNRDSTIFLSQPDIIKITDQNNMPLGTIDSIDSTLPTLNYPTIYYGHGMGYKGMKHFEGQILRNYLSKYFTNISPEMMAEGIVSISAIDGYRASFSLSEIMNRNDHREILLMYGLDSKEEDGRAKFSIFAGCDNFADRSIKGTTEIRLILPK